MNKELMIEYEVFEEEEVIVLSVVDKEKDEVINMFNGKMAEDIYRFLSSAGMNKLDYTKKEQDEEKIKVVMKEIKDEINFRMNFIIDAITIDISPGLHFFYLQIHYLFSNC